MLLFIDFILKRFYLGWGIYLSSLIKLDFFIFLILIVILLILIVQIRKKSPFKKIIILSVYLIFYIVFVVFPFYNGKEILELETKGNQIVKSLNDFEFLNKHYPNNLSELYPEFININDLNFIQEHVMYKLYRSDSLNFLNKNNPYYIPLKKDQYSLIINNKTLEPYFMKYYGSKNKFLITDD